MGGRAGMMGEGLARPIGPNTHALSPLSASSAPRPYMASFSCDPADGGGVIAVNPGGVATPAFCAKYNQVSETEGARRTARVFSEMGPVSPLSFLTLSSSPLLLPSVTATAASSPWPTRRDACPWWRRAGRPCPWRCTRRPGRARRAPLACLPPARAPSGCATTMPSSTWRGRG